MRISVLILAFKNPGQLKKLVDILRKDFDIYIHFDKNSDIDRHFTERPNVHIVRNRFATYWGSRNAILATLELLKAAHNDGSDYNIVISGQDLPLKPNSEIRSYFTNNYRDHVYYFPLTKESWGGTGLTRLSLFWENKLPASGIVSYIRAFSLKLFFAGVRALQKISGIRRPIQFEAYGGSFHLNFTREATRYILDYTKNEPWYLERFAHTRCADEIFFQTILLGSDYPGKNNIINTDLRYQDWENGPTYPRVFTIEDYDRCIHATEPFARKFDENIDAEIINRILSKIAE